MTTSHSISHPVSALYILQCNYARIEGALQELQSILQADDILLILEDAVFALHHKAIETFTQVYILQSDTSMLPAHLDSKIDIIDYLQFAELIHSAQKVHTWK